MKLNEEENALDAVYLGVQKPAGIKELYQDLLNSIVNSELGVTEEAVSLLSIPNISVSAQLGRTGEGLIDRHVVLGGGLHSPYEKLDGAYKHFILGVRGFLTLNRLSRVVEENAVVGELAILSSKLDIEAGKPTNLLYVGALPSLNEGPLSSDLRELGASTVSIADGLEAVIRSVKAAELVISESFVGLAIADSFGVPNIWYGNSFHSPEGFQVRDYLSGVDRATHLRISHIPSHLEIISRRARTAKASIVEQQADNLLQILRDLPTLKASLQPVEVLEEPRDVDSDGFVFEFPEVPMNSGLFEFDYSFAGEKSSRQLVASFDLVFEGTKGSSDLEQLPDFWRSPRTDIGWYQYIDLQRGAGHYRLVFELPEGVLCRGLRLLRWAGKDASIKLSKITQTRLR